MQCMEVRLMIEDIQKFLQEETDFETNQQYIGMKYLFRGFMIKSQMGANFNMNQYTNYNRILI